jgi:hypothetical protein
MVGEAAYKYETMNNEKDTPKLTDGNPLDGREGLKLW